ncbi:MAG: tetratricopeptide repeat protein [Candidatus Obscuribacterales bacterium]
MSLEPPPNNLENASAQVHKLVGDIDALGLREAFERVLQAEIPVGILQVACQNKAGAILVRDGSIKAAIAPSSQLLGEPALRQILSADEGKYRFTTDLPREPVREVLDIDLSSLLNWRHPAQPDVVPSLVRALETLMASESYTVSTDQHIPVYVPEPDTDELIALSDEEISAARTSPDDCFGLQDVLARFEAQKKQEAEDLRQLTNEHLKKIEAPPESSPDDRPLPMNRSTDQQRRASAEHPTDSPYRITGGHRVTGGHTTGTYAQLAADQTAQLPAISSEITLPTGETLKESRTKQFRQTSLFVGIATVLITAAVIATNKVLTETNAVQGMQGGNQLLKDGYKDLAKKSFARVIEKDPNNVPALLGRAAACLQMHDLPAASADYAKVLTLDPGNIEAMNGQAGVFVQLKDYADAVALTDTAIKAKPDNARALLIQSQAYLAMGQNKQAADAATRIIEKKAPDVLAAAYAARGDAFLALKKFGEAYSDFSQALLVDPSNRANFGKRAQAELARYEYNAAIADVNQAIFADQSNPTWFMLRAQALAKTDQLDKAVEDLDKAVELKPSIDTYGQRARVHMAMKNYNRAYADLCEICKDPRAPVSYQAQRDQVEARLKKGQVKQVDVESLISTSEPARVLKYDEMVREGYARLNAGDAQGALQLLSMVVKTNPSDLEARRYLARAYQKTGHGQEAVEQFKYVQDVKPLDGHDTYCYAQALYDLREYNQATPLLTALVNREPDYAEARVLLVNCLLLVNDQATALEVCRAGASRARTPQDIARFQQLYRVAQAGAGQ